MRPGHLSSPTRLLPLLLLLLSGVASTGAAATVELRLDAVQAPERNRVELELEPTDLAAGSRAVARVQARAGQARIEVDFRNLKPAVLLGGDVTSYVLWAVAPDGKTENLGELWVRSEHGTARYTTGQKNFALLVTAESHYLVDRPSELVVLYGQRPKSRRVASHGFQFSDFAPAPAHQLKDVSNFSYTGTTPLDLLQAEKALELARRNGADEFSPDRLREANTTLVQARKLHESGAAQKHVIDYARRSVTLSSEAMRVTARELAERQRRAEEERRRIELSALETRATDAETAYREAEVEKARLRQEIDEARGILDGLRADRQRLADDMTDLAQQRDEMEAAMAALRQEAEAAEQRNADEKARLVAERAELEAAVERLTGDRDRLTAQEAELAAQVTRLESERAALESTNGDLRTLARELEEEKSRLENRLQGALGQVAETRRSARGLVVSLPDILFDIDQATLKPAATLVLAKLSGILALMPELNLRIEGHTDSTGSREYNQRLAESRARSVSAFLGEQGMESHRLTAVGYGMDRPVADNATREGRAQNRRVEIVVAEGEIGEPTAEVKQGSAR